MRPRTLAIVLTVILGGAVTLRLLSQWFDLWPTTEEAWLKRATAISVRYFDKDQQKSLWISEAGELKEILGCLSARSEGYILVGGFPQSAIVTFMFRGGSSREYQIYSRHQIGHLQIDRAFTDKLQEAVSRKEGKPINLFATGDPFLGKR